MKQPELTIEELADLELRYGGPLSWRGCKDHPEKNSNSGCWGIYEGERKLPLLPVGETLVEAHNALPALIASARRLIELESALEFLQGKGWSLDHANYCHRALEPGTLIRTACSLGWTPPGGIER